MTLHHTCMDSRSGKLNASLVVDASCKKGSQHAMQVCICTMHTQSWGISMQYDSAGGGMVHCHVQGW